MDSNLIFPLCLDNSIHEYLGIIYCDENNIDKITGVVKIIEFYNLNN